MADKLTANIPGTQTNTMRATLISPTLSTEVPSITIKDDWIQYGRDAFSTGGAYELYRLIEKEIKNREDGDNAIRYLISDLDINDVDLSSYTTIAIVESMLVSYFNTITSPYIDGAISNLNLEQYVTSSYIQEFIEKVQSLPSEFITESRVTEIVEFEIGENSLVTSEMLEEALDSINEDIVNLETSIETLETDVASLETSIETINTTIDQGLVTRAELNTLVGNLNTILDEINN